MVTVAVIWLIFAIVVAAAANGRGRAGFGWFILAVVISPLLAGLLLAILPDLRTRALLEGLYNARSVDDEALRQNVSAGQGLPSRKKPRSLTGSTRLNPAAGQKGQPALICGQLRMGIDTVHVPAAGVK
jgi:hypothetical protein